MRQRVFVYGTLLRGEVNHHLLAQAEYLGSHRTAACFSLYLLRAYPGAVRGGTSAIQGEVYGVDRAGLRRLDRLEDYPDALRPPTAGDALRTGLDLSLPRIRA
jgi:gamma-glutamylaminecyclotransferase